MGRGINFRFYLKLIFFSILFQFWIIPDAIPQGGSTPLLERQNFLGFQLNPFFNDVFFDELTAGNFQRSLWVFSVHYGRDSVFFPNLTIGGEFHQHRTFRADPGYSFFTLGPFARYSHRVFTWAGVFAEASPMVSYSVSKIPNLGIENKDFEFIYYFAPGISLGQHQKRFSVDLFWKFSGKVLIDGNKNVFSFKLNYHF